MNEYKTIRDCAIDLIHKEGTKLTNRQIAEKVRKVMHGAKTTWKSIAFYKSELKHDKSRSANPYRENREEVIIQNEAERYVCEVEKNRTGKQPKISPQNSRLGYDIDSDGRHIEVKSAKSPKKWLNLTPNESEKLINDPDYWLYLVEGDFEKKPLNIRVYMIPKNDLLEMTQIKVIVRLTRLSNLNKRKEWLYNKTA